MRGSSHLYFDALEISPHFAVLSLTGHSLTRRRCDASSQQARFRPRPPGLRGASLSASSLASGACRRQTQRAAAHVTRRALGRCSAEWRAPDVDRQPRGKLAGCCTLEKGFALARQPTRVLHSACARFAFAEMQRTLNRIPIRGASPEPSSFTLRGCKMLRTAPFSCTRSSGSPGQRLAFACACG